MTQRVHMMTGVFLTGSKLTISQPHRCLFARASVAPIQSEQVEKAGSI